MFLLSTNTNQNNMFTFLQYLKEATSKELDIKDLEKMIKNPDRKRVKSYGGTKYVDMLKSKLAKLKESTDLEEAKIPSSNISKFSSPQAAKRAASKQKYKTQIFMGDDGTFWVPSTNKEAGQLKKAGYEVYESADLEEAATWKSEGHYTADGKEWTGDQHEVDGQVMTGKVHTDDSVNLYHFKELSPEVRKQVAASFE